MSRKTLLGRVATCAVLGPLTGPLALGLASCIRARRPWMASVYVLGIVEVVVGLPLILKAQLELLATLH
jgi:hypothetical protein